MTQRNENHPNYDEGIYNLDEPNIGIHYCKCCKRHYNGDFGQSWLDMCDNCLLDI